MGSALESQGSREVLTAIRYTARYCRIELLPLRSRSRRPLPGRGPSLPRLNEQSSSHLPPHDAVDDVPTDRNVENVSRKGDRLARRLAVERVDAYLLAHLQKMWWHGSKRLDRRLSLRRSRLAQH